MPRRARHPPPPVAPGAQHHDQPKNPAVIISSWSQTIHVSDHLRAASAARGWVVRVLLVRLTSSSSTLSWIDFDAHGP